MGKKRDIAQEVEVALSGRRGGFVLLPGGLIYEKDDEGELLHRTSYVASLLFDRVHIHPDFTVSDLFALMAQNAAALSIVYHRQYFSQVLALYHDLTEGRLRLIRDEHAVKVGEDGQEYVAEAVELSWFIHAEQGESLADRELRERIESGAVHEDAKKAMKVRDADGEDLEDIFEELAKGRKETIKRELADGSYWRKVRRGFWVGGYDFPDCSLRGRQRGGKKLATFSMSLMPLHELLPLKLRLSKELVVRRKDKELKSRGCRTIYKNPSLTLGQLIQGFLFELSFHGSPSDTSEVSRIVKDYYDEVRRGSDAEAATGQALPEGNED